MSDRSSPVAPTFFPFGPQAEAWDVTFKVRHPAENLWSRAWVLRDFAVRCGEPPPCLYKKKDHRLCSWVRLDRCGGGTEVGGFCVESSIGPWRLGVWSMETPVVLGFCFVSVDFFLLLQEQFFGRLRIFSEDASVV